VSYIHFGEEMPVGAIFTTAEGRGGAGPLHGHERGTTTTTTTTTAAATAAATAVTATTTTTAIITITPLPVNLARVQVLGGDMSLVDTGGLGVDPDGFILTLHLHNHPRGGWWIIIIIIITTTTREERQGVQGGGVRADKGTPSLLP